MKTNPTNVPAEPSIFRMLVLAAAVLAVYAVFSVARAQTPAQNKQCMKAIYEAFDTGNTGALDQLLAVDCVDHGIPPGLKNGREATKWWRWCGKLQRVNYHPAAPSCTAMC